MVDFAVGPLYIIMEYISHGNLRDVLRMQRLANEQLMINRYVIQCVDVLSINKTYIIDFGYNVTCSQQEMVLDGKYLREDIPKIFTCGIGTVTNPISLATRQNLT